MGHFDYHNSNIHYQTDSQNPNAFPTLAAVLSDFFKGRHKSRADANSPLFHALTHQPSNQNEFFKELFPETIVGFNRNNTPWSSAAIRAFLGGQKDNLNFGPGNNVLKSLERNPAYTLKQFASSAEKLFNRTRYTCDEQEVISYLTGWKKGIMDILIKEELKSHGDMLNIVFNRSLTEKRYDMLTAQLLLTMIAASQPRYNSRTFAIKASRLKLIWFSLSELTPTDIDSIFFDAQAALITCEMWYKDERYTDSFRSLSSLLTDPRFEKMTANDQSHCRTLLAQHLLCGHGCQKDFARAIELLEACPNHPNANYLLSGCYRGIYNAEMEDLPRAAEYMAKAAHLNHPQAILDFARHCLLSSAPLYSTLCETDAFRNIDRYQKASELLNKANIPSLTTDQRGAMLYLRGLILEQNGNISEATEAFKKAVRLGNRDAQHKLSRPKRNPHIVREHVTSYDCSQIDVLTNCTHSPLSELFISSLKGDPQIYTTDLSPSCRRTTQTVCNIQAFLEQMGLVNETLPNTPITRHRVAVFFSEDEQKNLYDALELVDLLYNVVIEQEPSMREKITDTFDIYVLCEYRRAVMFVDANLNDMLENIYFKVHICDPARDAAHQLLHDTPLFIPLLQHPSKHECRVVILSHTPFSYTMAREIVATGYMGQDATVTLDILTADANRRRERFYADLPGLYKQAIADTPSLRCIIPHFHESDNEALNLTAILTDTAHPLHNVLISGDYFVVDVGTDSENIRMAILLRQELLKSTPTLDNLPLIAVRCRDARAAHSIETAILGNKPQGSDFWNRYNLQIFGTYDTLYTVHPLVLAPHLETTALAVHCCYAAASTPKIPQSTLATYYRSGYNRDSSLVTAISLRYRLFTAGLYAAKTDMTFNWDEDSLLGNRYSQWLNEDNLEKAGQIEQSRWNGFMLSRGWEAATLSQVQVYSVQTANGQQTHTLAKLHPFICEWEDLDETDQNTIFSNLKNAFGIDSNGNHIIKNPKNTTLKNVKDTAQLLQRIYQREPSDTNR